MPILADYLRDSENTLYRIYPDANGELHIAAPYEEDSWTDPSYSALDPLLYQTLTDSAGTTWYIYPTVNGELTISTDAPTGQSVVAAGGWREYTEITPTEATVGDEIYLKMKDTDSTDWYVYPNSEGELIITTTEPS